MKRYLYKGSFLQVLKLHEHAWYIACLKRDGGAGYKTASMESMPTFTSQKAAQEYLDDWARRKGLEAA